MEVRDIQKELCDAWDLPTWRSCVGCAEAVRVGRQQLQEITDLYLPKDIYNTYETGLCYAMATARYICTRGMRGTKQPHCFKRRSAAELGFLYKSNKKAWMTGQMF
ncbi:CENP-B protein [Phytophthora palmivora]|uniref:CENP-B protein n=1 Tax=Phytophthora palmivora TaxID=4796 RepID=A0A2P4YLK5_9STRA|nr:CENP-B protein [Phytophthora palmivora]